jgi:hypothetical protein
MALKNLLLFEDFRVNERESEGFHKDMTDQEAYALFKAMYPKMEPDGEDLKKFQSMSQDEILKELDKQSKVWDVFNETDGVPVSFEDMDIYGAFEMVKKFKDRFKHQGYYLTARRDRIDPEEVHLIISKGEPSEE